MRARSALVVLALQLAPVLASGQGQPPASSLELRPALLRGDAGATSAGLAWEGKAAVDRPLTTEGLRSWLTARLESSGAAALDPDANATPLALATDAGVFVTLYRPGTFVEPGQPSRGGYDLGEVNVAVRAAAAGNQRLTETVASLGGELTYTWSRAGFWWRLIPSFRASYAAVVPLRSAKRDSLALGLERHRRADVHAAWHLPTFWPKLSLHANVRYWTASGLPRALDDAGADRGSFTAFDASYATGWRWARIGVPELFVRRVGGEVPEEFRQRRTWMIGIVTAKGSGSER